MKALTITTILAGITGLVLLRPWEAAAAAPQPRDTSRAATLQREDRQVQLSSVGDSRNSNARVGLQGEDPVAEPASEKAMPEPPLEFHPIAGPYTDEYLGSLAYDQLLTCRAMIRSLQVEQRKLFEAEITDLDAFLTKTEYSARALSFDEQYYLPVAKESEVRFYFVDPVQYSLLHELRNRARLVQLAPSFTEHVELERAESLERVQERHGLTNVETMVSPDNSVFAAYGMVDGVRRPVMYQDHSVGY